MPRTGTWALTAVLAFMALAAAGQPFKYGCHYFRTKERPKLPFSGSAKAQIDETIARSDTFDILHYDIAIDVTDYGNARIAASTTITFTPLLTGLGSIRFDLFQLTVDSVTDADGPLVFEYDGAILKVLLPTEPLVGTDYDVTVHYHGAPYRDPTWGGFYFESDIIYNLGIGLSTIPPNFGKVWYPCFDSFVERATYAYHVKSANGRAAHCQGDLVSEVLLGGDTVVRTFEMNDAITTHVAAIAAADYQDSSWVHTGVYGPVPITLTARPASLPGMVAKFGNLEGAIDALEHWYGPQPYSRVGYVHTTDGAMEHPTNIAYPSFMNGQSALENQGLYSHELGHHWWGDKVTPHVHNDMWLKEGPAEYSAHLTEEWVHGHAAFVDMVKDNQLYVLKTAHLEDGGFQPLSPMPDPYIYGPHTYYKGASVMHNLRGYLGDTLFRQAMSGAQSLLAGTDITPEEFRDALETASGKDLHPFFADQVFSPGFSVFVVQDMQATPSGGQWSVDLTVRQRLRAAPAWYEQVPLDLTLIGDDLQRQEYTFVGGGEYTPVNVTCDFEPVMAVINGHARLNQARMDHEFTVRPGESFSSTLPYVDFKLYPDAVPDSALMRIEHIWAGPDNADLGWGIDAISSTHYWIVDGIWPAGLAMHARLYYDGQVATDLDWDLYGPTEAAARLVYRASPSDPWEVYPDVTVTPGGLTDGSGYMLIDPLRKGQYAFANGGAIAGAAEVERQEDGLRVYPVPATDRITIEVRGTELVPVMLDICDAQGRHVLRTNAAMNGSTVRTLDVAGLDAGAYSVCARTTEGRVLGSGRFCLVR